MSESLRDQLIKAGLAKSKKKGPNQRRQSKGQQPDRRKEPDLATAYRLRDNEENKRRAEKKARQQAEDRKRREINKRIRSIIKAHSANDDSAELSRNFLYKGRIRKVNVTAEQLDALNKQLLGIVYLSGRYYLLPAKQVAQVQEISADHVPDLSGEVDSAEEEFPVPDDLTW